MCEPPVSSRSWQAVALVSLVLSVAAVIVGALFVGGLHGAGVALMWLGIGGLLASGYAFLGGIL